MNPAEAGPGPDFDAAEMFLRQARDAHKAGELTKAQAAIRLVAVALGLKPELGPR